jgi:hypothetical protein
MTFSFLLTKAICHSIANPGIRLGLSRDPHARFYAGDFKEYLSRQKNSFL